MTLRDLLVEVDDDQRVHIVIDANEESTAIVGTSRGVWEGHPHILEYIIGIITANNEELVVRVHKGES